MLLDTTAEAARARWRILAAMTGEARLRQALELTDFVYRITADGRRARAGDSQGGGGAHLQTREPAGS